MTHGSLFSGIGGFDLAAEWMGWKNIFHCEINEFGQKILKYYWPNAITYNDITKTDFTIHRGHIDILTGGFPCQPFSQAGKRKGTEDDRHLWPEMLRAIREIQPSYIVGENVYGIVNWNGGLVFDQVQSDLETEGYEVQSVILPACAVNAPHKRDRVWFIANRSDAGIKNLYQQKKLPNKFNISANSGGKQFQRTPQTSISENTEENRSGVDNWIKRFGNTPNASNAKSQRLLTPDDLWQSMGTQEKTKIPCGERNAQTGNWEIFPTQSPICGGDDGISDKLDSITFPKWRNESIKAYGNAIVPQVAFEIFKVIEQIELNYLNQ